MCKEAYPEGYKLGSDNQSWLMRMKFKYFQVPLTHGPRCKHKWREIPRALFAIGWPGFRIENTDGTQTDAIDDVVKPYIVINSKSDKWYISRIQPWSRWHFALHWPLGITWHIFWCQKNVVKFPTYKSSFGITKLLAGYLGWIRDSDKIYKPKLFIGGNFE